MLRSVVAFAAVLSDLPELRHPDGIRLLWSVCWFDGPCTGVAEMAGRLVWYEEVDSIDGERRYGVFDLTSDQMADHVARHEIWSRRGGNGNEFVWDGDAAAYRRGDLTGDGDWSPSDDWVFETDECIEHEGLEPIAWFIGIPRAVNSLGHKDRMI